MVTVHESARKFLSSNHAFFRGNSPVSQTTFRAASPTFAAPARSPEESAILMTSHVCPTTSPMALNAVPKSAARPRTPSAHISHAPVSFHTAATSTPSAAATMNAGLEIAAHVARATIFTPIRTIFKSVNTAISPLTAAIGASTTTFNMVNTVQRPPTASAIALTATPATINAAPNAATPAMTFTAIMMTSLCAAHHSAMRLSICEILSM
ncbi:hypothetical protein SDC9_89795 [bioreactor metagenome]|uniref:Uncharacterized protein n=1 Tax=bioreactor metagenome TaxID=1076179 RepID=A0A644ZQI2_9ZZZZ